MNIFVLSECPVESAQMQCNKHVVKMIVESAQMLSTAHRMLDGNYCKRPSVSGKTMSSYWELDDSRESKLYKAVHMGHPCTVWTSESSANYDWHVEHFEALCDEYTYRYERTHATDTKLRKVLRRRPDNIPMGDLTPFKLAMGSNPECMLPDPVESYRRFYKTKQERFSMTWSKRSIPQWFVQKTA
jgi:hypothetical protein